MKNTEMLRVTLQNSKIRGSSPQLPTETTIWTELTDKNYIMGVQSAVEKFKYLRRARHSRIDAERR